jgi:hypothetical protein
MGQGLGECAILLGPLPKGSVNAGIKTNLDPLPLSQRWHATYPQYNWLFVRLNKVQASKAILQCIDKIAFGID